MFDTANFITFGWFGATCSIIAAKWAAGLGFSQTSQLLWATLAFFLPPVALMTLYVRDLNDRKARGLPGANWA